MPRARRTSLAILLALAALALTLLRLSRPAAAGEFWCWDDPTLVVGGQTVHLSLGVPVQHRGLAHGSALTVTVPANVSAHLTGTNARNFPLTVTLVQDGQWSGAGAI